MRNNKATWIFLGLLAVAIVWRGISFGGQQSNPIYPLLVFVLALYAVISFTEWAAKPQPHGFIRTKLAFLSVFAAGKEVPFWHRQIIFFGGFGLAYAYLIWAAN